MLDQNSEDTWIIKWLSTPKGRLIFWIGFVILIPLIFVIGLPAITFGAIYFSLKDGNPAIKENNSGTAIRAALWLLMLYLLFATGANLLQLLFTGTICGKASRYVATSCGGLSTNFWQTILYFSLNYGFFWLSLMSVMVGLTSNISTSKKKHTSRSKRKGLRRRT